MLAPQDSLAGLVWGGPGWQRLHGEELLAALDGINAGAGQCEGGGGPGDAHAHGHDKRFGHVTQLLRRVREKGLEHTAALPYGLRDEVTGEHRDTSALKRILFHVTGKLAQLILISKQRSYFFRPSPIKTGNI